MDLFHRHRSKYYALIRQWYQEGLLQSNQQESRKKASFSARDALVHYDYILTLQLHENQYCFSSFYEDFDPVLPFLFTDIEKKYLKTLLPDPLFRQWLGEEAWKTLENYLSDCNPFPIFDFFQEMTLGSTSFSLENPRDLILLYNAIVEKRLIAFSYCGTDGIPRETQEYYPFRLMLDKETGLWQLLAFTKEEKFEVVCNLDRITNLQALEDWFSQDLQEILDKNRENQILSLKVRPDFNSIERTFLHFHDYSCSPHYDKKNDEYSLDISYHPRWDEEDLFSKVLSLGSAVEVLKPAYFRGKITDELRKMLEDC